MVGRFAAMNSHCLIHTWLSRFSISLWVCFDSLCLSINFPSKGTSLVAQWLRIHLLMQGTRVRALVREDPTCCGATKPMHHNYWACALELMSHNYWAGVPQLSKPICLEPVLHTAMKRSPLSLQLEKACTQQWKPKAAKSK